jgi:hypothetical protein
MVNVLLTTNLGVAVHGAGHGLILMRRIGNGAGDFGRKPMEEAGT